MSSAKTRRVGPPVRLIFFLSLCVCLSSCLVFKTYNSAARYKDNNRTIELTTDTTIIVGNGAKNHPIKSLQNE